MNNASELDVIPHLEARQSKARFEAGRLACGFDHAFFLVLAGIRIIEGGAEFDIENVWGCEGVNDVGQDEMLFECPAERIRER